MERGLDFADRLVSWALIALGCVHVFLAAPAVYPELTEPALWFVTGGLALWYAGALNVARVAHGLVAPHLRLATLFANVTLLLFVLVFAMRTGEIRTPLGLLLIGFAAAATAFTVRTSLRARSR